MILPAWNKIFAIIKNANVNGQSDLEQVEQDWQQAVEQLQEIEESPENWLPMSKTCIQRLRRDKSNCFRQRIIYLVRKKASQQWQMHWDEFNQYAAKTTQDAQVEQTRIQHLEQKLSSLKERQN